MSKKVYVTDCEGPLTINDNAYEACSHFIQDGSKLYKILSSYDDYLVEVEKREGYHVGGTLAYITPFFKAEDITNQDLIDYAKETLKTVNGVENSFFIAEEFIDSYIVSTSYGQYIRALCDEMDFPYENTYHTEVDLDSMPITDGEKVKVEEFRCKILECNLMQDYRNNLDSEELEREGDLLDDIFFNQFKNMSFAEYMFNINPVGGIEKEKALKDIIEKNNIDPKDVIYAGDSITDLEPLQYVKSHGGLAVAFNGNEYAINAAEVAIISEDAIPFTVILDLFYRIGKYYTMGFIDQYEFLPEGMYEGFRISHRFLDYFKEHFNGKEYPIIAKITDENRDELAEKSIEMRAKLRGKDIASIM